MADCGCLPQVGHHPKGTLMFRHAVALCGLFALIAACSTPRVEEQSGASKPVFLFEGARLIAGDGSAPIDDSEFLVERGIIARIGRKGELTLPAGAKRVDLSGKTVMPALI